MDEDQELGWLIRDTSNKIRGPFKQAEIVQMIKKGQLRGKTEVSRANSYWFAIEEKGELGRFMPEFNGGKPPPEAPTQMTATLTEADIQDHGVEITTFTPVLPSGQDAGKGAAPEGAAGNGEQIEWLSDEFAEEFGEDFGTTISIQTDVSGQAAQPGEAAPLSEEEIAEQKAKEEKAREDKARDEKARQEMLRRATVKADTLPSEHKSFHGERPKPIDTLMRSPGKPGSSAIKEAHHHTTVNVPVEEGPAPKMFMEEEEPKQRDRGGKKSFVTFAIIAVVILVGAAAFFFLPKAKVKGRGKPSDQPRHVRVGEDAMASARQSILTFDLEGAKDALSDLELEPGARAEASTYLAQAVVKKEFLYDVEGAMLALQTARQQAHGGRVEAEVDNLMAVYGFDRDPASSTDMFRKNAETYKDDPIFKYNLALALLRTNKPVEAIGQLDNLIASIGSDNALLEDTAVALGWALEAHCSAGARDAICKRPADAEDAYQRALEANPSSAKAQLGLALFRLRRTRSVTGTEGDFHKFIDLAPDLDPPTRVTNFRKLGNDDFYNFAHAQIIDLNTPSQSMKPSPLIMAVDAIVSAIQGRTSEAGKILESALSAAQGDDPQSVRMRNEVLKASGYLRWKDGQLNEVVDGLKDLRDRNSFAINLMLGKSYLKLRRRDVAEKYFRAINENENFRNHSEGHSLLGEMLLEQPEKADEARVEFQVALKKDPLDIVALRGLQHLGAGPTLSADLLKNLPF